MLQLNAHAFVATMRMLREMEDHLANLKVLCGQFASLQAASGRLEPDGESAELREEIQKQFNLTREALLDRLPEEEERLTKLHLKVSASQVRRMIHAIETLVTLEVLG